MSSGCSKYKYHPESMAGALACPFNALNWDLLVRHEDELRASQRMPFVHSSWEKFSQDKRAVTRAQASMTLKIMKDNTP